MDIVTLSLEHQDEFFGNMAMAPRPAARRYLVKVDVFAFGRDHHFGMNQPFDPPLAGPLPGLLFFQYDVRRMPAQIGFFVHEFHVAVIGIALFSQRHTELKPVVNAVLVHLADIVVDPGGAEHRAGNARVDGQFSGQDADTLRARDEDLVFTEQPLEFIQKSRVLIDHPSCLFEPAGRQVAAATAKTHVIAHHSRPGERLEKVEDLFALAEGVHQGRARSPHVL